jgi:hypothetical protein
VPQVGALNRTLPLRALEIWLWSGPVGHLVGGSLDFAQALARYLRSRRRAGRTAP